MVSVIYNSKSTRLSFIIIVRHQQPKFVSRLSSYIQQCFRFFFGSPVPPLYVSSGDSDSDCMAGLVCRHNVVCYTNLEVVPYF